MNNETWIDNNGFSHPIRIVTERLALDQPIVMLVKDDMGDPWLAVEVLAYYPERMDRKVIGTEFTWEYLAAILPPTEKTESKDDSPIMDSQAQVIDPWCERIAKDFQKTADKAIRNRFFLFSIKMFIWKVWRSKIVRDMILFGMEVILGTFLGFFFCYIVKI